ncbi:MAG: putative toxin-antitoxin system toxin component, PIN family [Alphaproteobacteria bacterium]|nr:putative toxin-antitoxin system toxin component, PIN family [Alphaproteobacteria bacterium]
MKAERVVLDTSVLISAALRRSGRPRVVVEAVREERGALLFSDETLDELRSRFHRPKFDRYVGREGRAVYLAQLEAVSEWVSIAGAKLGCRDPDDDKLLETALMGAADCLVTGDRDLLEMSPFQDIPILTPAGFLDLRITR